LIINFKKAVSYFGAAFFLKCECCRWKSISDYICYQNCKRSGIWNPILDQVMPIMIKPIVLVW